jgi:chromosome partitioning protein
MISVQTIGMQKGGVGKTTSAYNLGAEYALTGAKTLLIDGDKQANLTKTFGVDPELLESEVYDIFQGNKYDIEKLILSTEYDNLWIVPSSAKLAEVISKPPMAAERAISRFLAKIWDDFDYVVIDTPPGDNIITTAAMEASNGILLPIQCETYALEGITPMIHSINKAQEVLNDKLQIIGAFMTMVNEQLSFYQFAKTEVEDFFKNKLFKTMIHRTTRVTEAENKHMPIRYYDPKNKASLDYHELAVEVINRL